MVIGRHSYAFPEENPFNRALGNSEPGVERPAGHYRGKRYATLGAIDDDADARIRDQDEEGVDCQLLIGGSSSAGPSKDLAIAVGFMRAYNRYLNDFCGKYPHRLKALLPIVPGAVEESVEEINRWGKTPWAVGVYPNMANDTPLEWRAAAMTTLVVGAAIGFAASRSRRSRLLASLAPGVVDCDFSFCPLFTFSFFFDNHIWPILAIDIGCQNIRDVVSRSWEAY